MSKRKSLAIKPYPPVASKSSAIEQRGAAKGGASGVPADSLLRRSASPAAIRETIESIVIAFVLAFLFRTFEAEAFVIPTGSMAPTLMGRHKDLNCPKCGYAFQVGASEEVTQDGVSTGLAHRVEACTCPMCRYTMNWGPGGDEQRNTYTSFKGDRILVEKFAYQFNEPQRWDVTVFRYPGDAQVNFIKRLVGLPNESLTISHGDIFVKHDGESEYKIARKPPRKLLAMLQPVFDNELMPRLIDQGWPARWQVWPAAAGQPAQGFKALDDRCSFQADGTAGESWIRYQHLVPSFQQWENALSPRRSPAAGEPMKPQLISDFAAYNTNRDHATIESRRTPDLDSLGLHWVGDLALKCTVDVQSDKGTLVLELVKGGRQFQCQIDVATGTAALSIVGRDLQEYHPTAMTKIHGPGKHQVMFSNCDEELLLWVDGREVKFDAPTSYPTLDNARPRQLDLAPVAVGSIGAALTVSHLNIQRDIYYIAERVARQRGINGSVITDFKEPPHTPHFLSEPREWSSFGSLKETPPFVLAKDQFLALGDNSAKSKDSRLWEQEGFDYFVKRDLLIGKAFYIYWPHSWDSPVPFFPNYARMGFVR